MSKISETGVGKFSYLNQNFDVFNLHKSPDKIGNSANPDFHSANPNAYDSKLVYNRSSYVRQSLNNKENSNIGGGERLNANSSTQKLLTPPQPNQTVDETLKRGQRGRSVEALQDKLIRLGLMTKAQKLTGAGIFGPRTEAAVKKFQRSVGIKPSGEAGTNTRATMNNILSGDIKKGATGGIVRQMQNKLVRLGYMTQTQFDTGRGIFGPQTDAALKRFQARHNLADDGIFGPKTFNALRDAAPRRSQPNQPPKPPTNGDATEYKRWNVYSTGDRPARQADGYEDLQKHHGPKSQWTNYVSRNVRLNHNLQKHDIVLTRPGQGNYGQAVPSPLKGKVLFAGDENDGYGNKVVVRNTRTGQIMSVNHLESINVRRGETVAYGQNLGGQGNSGNSRGAHIHINADPSVIKRWVADLADGRFDGTRRRFDVGRRP